MMMGEQRNSEIATHLRRLADGLLQEATRSVAWPTTLWISSGGGTFSTRASNYGFAQSRSGAPYRRATRLVCGEESSPQPLIRCVQQKEEKVVHA